MFAIGDKVKFKNEKGEGVVSKIDNKYIFVAVEDGFEIPFLPEQLILIKSAKKDSEVINQKNEEYIDKKEYESIQSQIEGLTDNIYLAFTAIEKTDVTVESVILNLINDTEDFINYYIFIVKDNKLLLLDSDKLEPATKISLADFDKSDYLRIEKIILQIIRYNKNKKGQFLEHEFIINSSLLIDIKSYVDNEFFEEKALLFPLTIKDIEETKEEFDNKIKSDLSTDEIKKKNVSDEKESKRKKGIVEYDLHIDALRSDFAELTPSQILNIQLSYFRQKLEECIEDKSVKKVVFIHGVGNGTLKLEICKILQKEYAHYDYQDASYAEYGYGATMVILRK